MVALYEDMIRRMTPIMHGKSDGKEVGPMSRGPIWKDRDMWPTKGSSLERDGWFFLKAKGEWGE